MRNLRAPHRGSNSVDDDKTKTYLDHKRKRREEKCVYDNTNLFHH